MISRAPARRSHRSGICRTPSRQTPEVLTARIIADRVFTETLADGYQLVTFSDLMRPIILVSQDVKQQ